MSTEPSLKEQTKKIFKETVDIYRNDFHAMLRKPWPVILVLAAMILFWFAIRWL